MTGIPWGILALLVLGVGALWLIVDAKESVGRLSAEKRKAEADLGAIEKANEADRKADAVPDAGKRERLRDWPG